MLGPSIRNCIGQAGGGTRRQTALANVARTIRPYGSSRSACYRYSLQQSSTWRQLQTYPRSLSPTPPVFLRTPHSLDHLLFAGAAAGATLFALSTAFSCHAAMNEAGELGDVIEPVSGIAFPRQLPFPSAKKNEEGRHMLLAVCDVRKIFVLFQTYAVGLYLDLPAAVEYCREQDGSRIAAVEAALVDPAVPKLFRITSVRDSEGSHTRDALIKSLKPRLSSFGLSPSDVDALIAEFRTKFPKQGCTEIHSHITPSSHRYDRMRALEEHSISHFFWCGAANPFPQLLQAESIDFVLHDGSLTVVSKEGACKPMHSVPLCRAIADMYVGSSTKMPDFKRSAVSYLNNRVLDASEAMKTRHNINSSV